jgi:replication factor A1
MADLLLTNIMPEPCNACICVRVSRFWDFCDPSNETKLLHSDMVLLDEEVSSVVLALYLTVFLILLFYS